MDESPTGMKMIRFKGLILFIVLVAIGTGSYIWKSRQTVALPEGFAAGNSRIDATEVDIACKTAGKVAEILVQEGDWVKAGQLLALMDTEQAEADLAVAKANLSRAQESKNYAEAILRQRQSEVTLAKKELERAEKLVKQGHLSQDVLDQRQTQRASAEAAMQAARVQVAEAQASIEAARAQLNKAEVVLEDSRLVAPRDGRVLYRLTEPGEILPAGGKVVTLIDVSDVYMTLFLPTAQASKAVLGAEARIVLDAWPDISVPAYVSFVAPQAQFTPRSVETQSEREKLMFRVKVKVQKEVLMRYAEQVKTGVPGMAYIRLDASQPWPEFIPPLLEY
jgi:HlyD family secretion protein